MEYFIKYKFKIDNIINDITDYKQQIYSVDSELHERLHIVWLGYFYELYVQPDSLYGIMWIFTPLNDNSQIIKTNLIWSKKISAKFRFCCSAWEQPDYCNHIWTSKKGYINIFIGHRPLNRIIDQSGSIINIYEFLFSLDQQKCTQCNSNKLISGSTYPHEVIKQTSENKQTLNSQIVSNSNGKIFKDICATKADQLVDSLKKSSEISKTIEHSKNYSSNETSTNCNDKLNNPFVNESNPLSIPEGKSSIQLLKDNNQEVVMTTNKLTNMNKNETDLNSKKEPASLNYIPKPSKIESTTFDDLKQIENQVDKKMSIRSSRYV
ncbi:unnamed protein product [Schistosoma spindalis]|nr:unnamed protein product [Schistosoma spindale]